MPARIAETSSSAGGVISTKVGGVAGEKGGRHPGECADDKDNRTRQRASEDQGRAEDAEIADNRSGRSRMAWAWRSPSPGEVRGHVEAAQARG